MLIHFKNIGTSKNNWLKFICFTTLMLSGALQAMDVPDLNQQLWNAAEVGNVEEVAQLLKGGADINAIDQVNGWTALMVAAKNDHFETCKLLIERGADVNAEGKNMTALGLAQDYNICKLLIDNSANVNAKNHLDSTILITAAMFGYSEKCKLLVENGADVNAMDQWRFTALKAIASRSFDQDFAQHFDPIKVKELCELLIDAMLKAPIDKALLKAKHLNPEQKSAISALVATLRNTPLLGIGHRDTKKLIIEDVIKSFKRRNFIEEQIIAKEPLKQQLLDYLNSRIEQQIKEGPQMMQKK